MADQPTPMTDTTIATQPLPGMPEPEPMWAVHVQGSDDIVPQPSREAADAFKAALDDLDVKNADKPMYPTFGAVVIEWPGTREEHAEALRREAEEG